MSVGGSYAGGRPQEGADMERMIDALRAQWHKTADEYELLREMRAWYGRWVHVRELRYRHLADILDDLNRLDAIQWKAGVAEPSSLAGKSQRIGAPATDSGTDKRCASPHAVCSTAGARSASVSGANGSDASCSP